MSMQGTGARLAAVGASALVLTVLGGGSALAAVGPDVGPAATPSVDVPAVLPQVAPAPAAPAASPTPTPGPVDQVVATVTGVVTTVEQTLGLAPKPSPAPSGGGSGTGTGTGTTNGGHTGAKPPTGAAGAPTTTHHRGRTTSGSISSRPLTSFGFGAVARLPHVDAVPGPQEGAVRGIGAAPYAAGQLPAAAARALGDDGVGEHSLPTLLVVVAAAACAAAAAGNVEVWRRRLADSLG